MNAVYHDTQRERGSHNWQARQYLKTTFAVSQFNAEVE